MKRSLATIAATLLLTAASACRGHRSPTDPVVSVPDIAGAWHGMVSSSSVYADECESNQVDPIFTVSEGRFVTSFKGYCGGVETIALDVIAPSVSGTVSFVMPNGTFNGRVSGTASGTRLHLMMSHLQNTATGAEFAPHEVLLGR